MRIVEAHLMDHKMDEAVTHYINSHQTAESVHVNASSLALNVQDDGGSRVTVMHPQTYSTTMCRQVSVGEQVAEGPWSEELLDTDGRIAAIVAQLSQHSRSHHPPVHHKVPTVRTDVDTSVILDGSMRFLNGQGLEHQSETIVVHQLPALPPLQDMKRCQDTNWFHNKSKITLKDNNDILHDDETVLELDPGASPVHNKQQSKKSLPHKKRISKKLKRNNGNSTPQQDIVVINCPDQVQQEEILPDNFVTGVQHEDHLPQDTHHITHEVRAILICQICGEFYGEDQLKFYHHLKQHYEPHATIIIENPVPDLGIDKMTNTCIVDNVQTLPDSIVELSLENTVPKTVYQNIDKHILYTSHDKTLNYTSNKVQYSMASMDKEVPTAETEKSDIYDSLDKLEFYSCLKCNKQFRKQKHCEAHIKEVHSNPKLEDMGEFSEPEDLMEGIHVSVEEGGEQYEQSILPHLTVENGQVHQEHVRQWYSRNGSASGSNGSLVPCGSEGAYCPVCPTAPADPPPAEPPANPPREQPSHSPHQFKVFKEEVLQRIFDTDVTNEQIMTEHIIPDTGPLPEESKPAEPEKKKEKKRFECVRCGRVFVHRNSLLYHMLSHNGKTQECKECGKVFYTVGALKIHKRVHNGDRPYKCEICEREFRQWSDLKYHKISLHSQEKLFKCDFCEKEFARKYSLNVHRRIHTGERNYKCDYCNKSFRASSYRLSHMRTHTGDRPHSCQICGKAFRVSGDLRRHMLIHDKVRNKPPDDIKTKPEFKQKIETLEKPKEQMSPKTLKKIAVASTSKLPNILKAEKKSKTNKKGPKKGAPNVTVSQMDGFKMNDYNEVYNVKDYGKYKEYDTGVKNEMNCKEQNERDFTILKPIFRNSEIDISERIVLSKTTENTDGKLQVFTQIAKKDYNGSILNSQVSLGDIRHLEREVAREVRSDIHGEAMESGFLERLTALYNIPAV
ncbi:hypothetical protein K1T71_005321 [Dendrolimus kikuchii]|uniref:Uncharacterized protein n=1 Tax=Dendrolimus kikuchii TaxID=765133 RepID=A0ACC1D6S8_9NEOP|nr:hypothetical protein K1T71_005321 [Dendrolimus kikuchii]